MRVLDSNFSVKLEFKYLYFHMTSVMTSVVTIEYYKYKEGVMIVK